jgi:cyclin B
MNSVTARGRISHGGALADITNIAAGRFSQSGHGKLIKPAHHSAQSSALAVAAAEPVPMAVEMANACPDEQEDAEGVQDVPWYSLEIRNKLFQEERAFMPRPNYMDTQVDITSNMRKILIDWLVEVHMKYRLRMETLHLAVNIIDRYLSKAPVVRKRLQLVGIVAMFIAAKFEEIDPPELHDWVYITDKAYTQDDVLLMECTMLTALGFQVVVPTTAHFFNFLEKANGCDATQRSMAQYVLELGLLDIRLLKYAPSHQVAAALLLSNEQCRRSPAWPVAMMEASNLPEQVLRLCVEEMRELLEADRAGQLQATQEPSRPLLQTIYKKFSASQMHGVAKMELGQ